MELVSAARTLIGKPFRHRGRGPVYFDCAGMVKEAYRLCGVDLPDFRLYSREPNQNGLVEHITKALGNPINQPLIPGDVIVVRFDIEPHHVAMVTDYRYGGLAMIHACGMNKRVIEHRLAPDHMKRITHAFRRPV